MPNYRLDIAYDGAPFYGYAIQKDQITVQGELEKALRPHTAGAPTLVAGRTDRGVHAANQVISFVSRELDTEYVLRSLNKQLGPHIAAYSLIEADEDFHARFSATGRAYSYSVFNRDIHDPLRADRSWHVREPLDVVSMNAAIAHLVGEHDFAALCRRYQDRTTHRRIHWALWRRTGDDLELSIGAKAFCHQLVRSVVALTAYVGKGLMSADEIPGILASGDRSRTKGVSPAHALTLVAVAYGDPLPRPEWVG
jgi:tRNA pseudouridine38-40 synthase